MTTQSLNNVKSNNGFWYSLIEVSVVGGGGGGGVGRLGAEGGGGGVGVVVAALLVHDAHQLHPRIVAVAAAAPHAPALPHADRRNGAGVGGGGSPDGRGGRQPPPTTNRCQAALHLAPLTGHAALRLRRRRRLGRPGPRARHLRRTCADALLPRLQPGALHREPPRDRRSSDDTPLGLPLLQIARSPFPLSPPRKRFYLNNE